MRPAVPDPLIGSRPHDAAALVSPGVRRPVESLPGDLRGVGTRRLRLHHPHLRPGRHPAEFLGQQGAGRAARHRDAALPGGRRHRCRHPRRPLRPEGADSLLDRLVHGVCVPERRLHLVRDAVRLPRAVRHRHGRDVGGWHAAGARALAAAPARHRLGHPAGRLLVRLPALVAGLPARLPAGQRPARMGVAGDAVVGRAAGDGRLRGDVDRAREPDLARTAAGAGTAVAPGDSRSGVSSTATCAGSRCTPRC